MSDFRVDIPKIKNFERAFAQAPRLTKMEVNKAVRASLAEIMKRQTDDYFLFKTPRPDRTGMLQRMFQLNTATAIAGLARARTLYHVEIESTVHYAKNVVLKGNPYYNRILEASMPDINKHNIKAMDNVLNKIVRLSR